MPFFSHQDNLQILWDAIQSSEQFKEFGYSNDKLLWFNNIIRTNTESHPKNMSVSDLINMNHYVVRQMMNEMSNYNNTRRNATRNTKSNTTYGDNLEQRSSENDVVNPNPHVIDDKSYYEKGNNLSNQFDERRKEYDLMSNPIQPKSIVFLDDDNAPLSNIDELVSQQLKNRAADMDFYKNNVSQSIHTSNIIESNRLEKPTALLISSSSDNLILTDVFTMEEPNIAKNVSWSDTIPTIISIKDNTINDLGKIEFENIARLIESIDARITNSEIENMRQYSEIDSNIKTMQKTIVNISSSLETLVKNMQHSCITTSNIFNSNETYSDEFIPE